MAKTKTTTAVSRYNAAATFNSGKVGNIRFYRKGERTYVRSAYNSSITNPRTDKQMKVRLKWANMSDAWRVLRPWLEKGFEGSTAFVSTFNLFMKANKDNGIYVTKEDGYKDLTKLQPMVVSMGSLDSVTNAIEASAGAYYVQTRLHVGESAFSTLGELSAVLIAENGLEDGDQITLLQVAEILPIGGGSGSGLGRLRAHCECVVLDTTSETSVSDLPFQSAKDTEGNLLFNFGSVGQKIGGAVIVSRKSDGAGLKTSTETLVLSPECNYADWLTEDAFRKAVDSYGGSEHVYLDPDGHKEEGNQPTPPPAGSYTLTLAVAQGQQSYGSVVGAGTYNAGTTVTIRAVANPGYHFVKWSDDDTNAERSITMTENKNLVATFALDTPSSNVTITITKVGDGDGTFTGAGQYTVGDTVTLQATAGQDSEFGGWIRGGTTHNQNPYTFQATANETIQCRFNGGDA